MECLAPKPVLEALSKSTLALIRQRLTSDYRLRPYIDCADIRIRGLKPSIQYSTYSVLNEQQELIPMYEVSAENEQTDWVMLKIHSLASAPATPTTPATAEAEWSAWEEQFFTMGHAALLRYPCSHLDAMGNTHAHLLAYACLNNRFSDIMGFEAHFQAICFQTNNALQHLNSRNETPLIIMMGSHTLHEFVQSILLRISPAQRFASLPFRYWQEGWSTLMHDTEHNHANLLLAEQPKTPHFLNRYRKMTYNSEEALRRLFAAGYQLNTQDLLTLSALKAQISQILTEFPTWHNLTLWLTALKAALPTDQFVRRCAKLIAVRTSLIRDEIMAIAFHPDRIANYVAMGYGMGDFSDII